MPRSRCRTPITSAMGRGMKKKALKIVSAGLGIGSFTGGSGMVPAAVVNMDINMLVPVLTSACAGCDRTGKLPPTEHTFKTERLFIYTRAEHSGTPGRMETWSRTADR